MTNSGPSGSDLQCRTVVVGAWLKNSNTGAAYIFERNQGGAENWGQVRKLTASDAAEETISVRPVSISAHRSVGASQTRHLAPVYSGGPNLRPISGAENWGQVQKLPTTTVRR